MARERLHRRLLGRITAGIRKLLGTQPKPSPDVPEPETPPPLELGDGYVPSLQRPEPVVTPPLPDSEQPLLSSPPEPPSIPTPPRSDIVSPYESEMPQSSPSPPPEPLSSPEPPPRPVVSPYEGQIPPRDRQESAEPQWVPPTREAAYEPDAPTIPGREPAREPVPLRPLPTEPPAGMEGPRIPEQEAARQAQLQEPQQAREQPREPVLPEMPAATPLPTPEAQPPQGGVPWSLFSPPRPPPRLAEPRAPTLDLLPENREHPEFDQFQADLGREEPIQPTEPAARGPRVEYTPQTRIPYEVLSEGNEPPPRVRQEVSGQAEPIPTHAFMQPPGVPTPEASAPSGSGQDVTEMNQKMDRLMDMVQTAIQKLDQLSAQIEQVGTMSE